MRNSLVCLFLFLNFLDDALLMTRIMNANSCPTIALQNGKVRRRQRGRFIKFVCNTGYLLAGERYSTCVHGKWDPLPPKCVRPTCMNRVHPPPNGLIYPSHSGAALHFFCKSGYELRGPTDVYCDGRKWDNNAPICLEANTKPKLFCDFETEDICGWTHDLNHDFDWRRENYNTPSGSIGTGPSFDHTKGNGKDGYYMYIESSSRNENDTARLISPIFEKTDTQTCLEFFYHMYGATTGSLRVYLKKTSDNWSLDPVNAVFSKSGNQGDRWYRSYHSLGAIAEEYQIVIEGVRGPGYVSDIAIDDVKIVENCVYEENMFSTTTEALYSTDIPSIVESCENRCGQKAFGNESHQITCDCDENCYSNSTCCPDYLDFCILESTTEDYYSTTDMPNEVVPLRTTPQVTQISTLSRTTVHGTTAKATTVVPQTTVRTTTTVRKPTTNKKTTKPPVRTTRTTPTTIKYKPTTIKYKPTTIKYTPTTRKVLISANPTIHVLLPPTTAEIIRKILPTVQPNAAPPNKETESNDVADVPKQKNNDEELLLTSPLPDTKRVVLQEHLGDEVVNDIDAISMGNLSESNRLLSQTAPESGNYNVVLIVISVVGLAVLTTVIAVFVIRRYRCYRKRMSYSNGDSQSDVRFLTSDEILDFSLDKDYDDL